MTAHQPFLSFDPIDERAPLAFPCQMERAAIHAINASPMDSNAGLPTLGDGDGASPPEPLATLLLPSAMDSLRPALAEGGSLFDILRARAAQLASGHSPQADRDKGTYEMIRLLDMRLLDAKNAWHINPNLRDPAQLRKDLIHLAATAAALVDVIDLNCTPAPIGGLA